MRTDEDEAETRCVADAETRGHGDAQTGGRTDAETPGKAERRFTDSLLAASPRPRVSVSPPSHVSASRSPVSASPARLPLIVGHRGAAAVAPENTLASFARAFEDGADGLEFDVQLARDGVPVVMHDPTLRRTALCPGTLSAHTSAELCELDVGTWFNLRFPALARADYARERVPLLSRVLRDFGTRARVLYVELKFASAKENPAPLVAAVVELVRAESLVSRVVVESFALEAVREVKRLAPEIRTAALFDRKLTRPLLPARTLVARALECRADEVALHYTLANRRTLEVARRAGLDALIWTVDRPLWAKRARTLGLRALITNHPARMRAALDRLRDED